MSTYLSPDHVEVVSIIQKHLKAMHDEIEQVAARARYVEAGSWWVNAFLCFETERVGTFNDELSVNEWWYDNSVPEYLRDINNIPKENTSD